MRGPDGVPIGELRRVIISNVVAYNVEAGQGVLISGIPEHNIKDIDLKDIKIWFKGAGTAEQAKRDVPELEKGYPEPDTFGILPAYGFFVRHAENIKIDNVELHTLSEDQRPAFVFDDVQGAELRFVKAQTPGGISPISIKKPSTITLFQSLAMPDGKVKN
ncbi:hypothetical protein KXD93_10405 [Mucilaginibacter sp. BJC16-A38]|uniref:hypothetical protein n=1 Tax=Mucilaginibacter phenanthrenivorans TaxID=1234842 RepID=UPI002157EFC8|nr:hypothetical protein [Mucilaginibacter phenanthrenivorans]MCR8558057.1 hypothetical protein [Mucilaginibacter phenanthrenivorans]